jgi:hypothetical protein
MNPLQVLIACLVTSTGVVASTFFPSASLYTEQLRDHEAIDLGMDGPFRITAGSDITALLQDAIDRIADRGTFGVVLIPSGTYQIRDTVFVWKGIRLIGYGPTRPLFLLPDNSDGFAGTSPKYLVHFASDKPSGNRPFRDANPGTFYSALSNIDFRLGKGNPAAVAIRSHYAQHCFISHARFEIEEGLAAIDEVGNVVHDCEFAGGKYAIITRKPSPSWPFVLLDSRFSNQQHAAILTEEAGMTVVRCSFSNIPVAVEMRPDRSEELVMDQCRFDTVTDAIVLTSEPENSRTQVNLLRSHARHTPVIARFRNGRPEQRSPDAGSFTIHHFSHGLHLSDTQPLPRIETRLHAEPATFPSSPVATPERSLPPSSTWVNVTSLGALGDGQFDNTEILRKAIEDHEVLFFPGGHYRVSDTLTLLPDTCLVGLSPITTRILIHDECPAFHPSGPPRALLESAAGGANIVQGIGLDAGAINHRAVALKWTGGESSVVNDVRFLGGHGTFDADGNYLRIYNNNRSADSDVRRRWDSMPASLWVTGNGGGTFKNLWSASPFAHAGMLIENTSTPGYVYQISIEHHLRHELILSNVSNWNFYGLQFEEEMWEGRHTLPLLIEKGQNLAFHNTWVYRVMRTFTPFPTGIEISGSSDLRFHGIHAYGPSKFTVDDTLRITDAGVGIRSREIACLSVTDSTGFQNPEDGAAYELLACGFNHIDSPEIDSEGNLLFVDEGMQRIWRWHLTRHRLERVLDIPVEPSQIVLVDNNTLAILTLTGKVWVKDLQSGYGYDGLKLVERQEAMKESSHRFALPTTRWRDSHDFMEVVTEAKPFFYQVGDTVIPAETSFSDARINSTWFNTLDLVRTYDLGVFSAGETVYVSDEFAQKTWRFVLDAAGQPGNPELFAEQGEAGVALDPGSGEVLIAAGHLFLHDRNGKLLRTLTPPHRPTAVHWARDRDGNRFLYLLARQHLYRVRM